MYLEVSLQLQASIMNKSLPNFLLSCRGNGGDTAEQLEVLKMGANINFISSIKSRGIAKLSKELVN